MPRRILNSRELLPFALGLSTFFGLASLSLTAFAEPTWQGDFENGALSQWSYQLNPEGLSIVDEPVLEGTKAAQIQITDQNLWSNGLNRVELQHKPQAGSVANGGDVYFGYSVYLPEALTVDDHQIGYWETDETYKQVMSLHARGQDLSFNTQQPYKVQWQGTGLLTPQTWHRIVYHVHWSDDASAGAVELWFDGAPVASVTGVKTYLGNPAFIQVGILRDTISTVETMFLDAALEGESYADVALQELFPDMPAPVEPEPATLETPGASGAGGASSTPTSGMPSAQPSDATSSSDGCSIARPGSRSDGTGWMLGLAAGVWCLARRRRRLATSPKS